MYGLRVVQHFCFRAFDVGGQDEASEGPVIRKNKQQFIMLVKWAMMKSKQDMTALLFIPPPTLSRPVFPPRLLGPQHPSVAGSVFARQAVIIGKFSEICFFFPLNRPLPWKEKTGADGLAEQPVQGTRPSGKLGGIGVMGPVCQQTRMVSHHLEMDDDFWC